MHIAILSEPAALFDPAPDRGGPQRGHEVSVVDPLKCVMDVTSLRPACTIAARSCRASMP
jgi:ribosomal protein S6--L-glutamate ligase